MGEWVTASTKVRREILEKAREYNINISEVLRKALEEEVRKREEEKARELLDLASKEVAKINTDEVVEELRKWRKER
ncbi:MAG: type II toxin-antitoxin system CcdA family antitoxin [Acidianus infernus]|uniref:type II toxin-antitoxin system CcdA family antitoxin n=1 Tax=Acidianus infernus TaxID=12915 RepID=UPI0022726AB9|nr:type II toxin-antitoxin system CcdA family antitoxin [Acidianus infernus]